MTDSEKTTFIRWLDKKKIAIPCRICPFNLMMCEETGCAFDKMREIVEQEEVDATVVDSAPVVHAHWVGSCEEHILPDTNGEVGPESCICSHCGVYLGGSGEYIVNGKFCPSCGARMDEKDGDSDGEG